MIFPYAIENEEILEEMASRYRANPDKYGADWQSFFDSKFPLDLPDMEEEAWETDLLFYVLARKRRVKSKCEKWSNFCEIQAELILS